MFSNVPLEHLSFVIIIIITNTNTVAQTDGSLTVVYGVCASNLVFGILGGFKVKGEKTQKHKCEPITQGVGGRTVRQEIIGSNLVRVIFYLFFFFEIKFPNYKDNGT